jgi:hypothetical protein
MRFIIALAATLVLNMTGAIAHADEPKVRTISVSSAAGAAQIARLKRVLQLTPAQERYWPKVEAALHMMARRSLESDGSGLAGRLHARAAQAAEQGALVAAAMPLMRSLSEQQKRDGMSFVRSMGVALPAGLY